MSYAPILTEPSLDEKNNFPNISHLSRTASRSASLRRRPKSFLPNGVAQGQAETYPFIVHCHLSWDWVWQRPQQFISRLGRTHKVLFVETAAPDSELAALLGGAELFIYPSRYEGFGIPPLLAMALGTPCVVSDAGALPEVVGEAATLFPSGDAAALAERLRAAARDPGALAARSRLGKERAARFKVDLLAERMTRVYDAAAARRGGSG